MKRLLTVGPLPPPPSGSTVSFQIFIETIKEKSDLQVDIIDTSPKQIKQNTSIASPSNLLQAAKFFVQFCGKIRQADRVLIFGSNGFLLSMTPLMVFVSQIARCPCYIRPFGGSLDQFHDGLPSILQRVLRFGLLRADGLIVETKLLYNFFHKLDANNVHYLQGYRPIDRSKVSRNKSSSNKVSRNSNAVLRLIFISWVRKEKGVFVLLEALRNLTPTEEQGVICDIYGPIVEQDRERFEVEIAKSGCANYQGVVDPREVVPLMQTYDALVFPTFYQGEGQPGVVLETMVAGIPSITTNFRSIPAVVQDGVTGILVEPQNVEDLTKAIQMLYHNPTLRQKMGDRNQLLRTQHDAKILIPALMAIVAGNDSSCGVSQLEPSTSQPLGK